MQNLRLVAILAVSSTVAVVACEDKAAPAAPAVSASAVTAPPPPPGPKVLTFDVDANSKTSIDMPAPKERIKADTTAAKGELSVDPTDLTKTSGQIKVDLTTLKTHTFDDAKKDASQTEHAHNWLEAGDLVTPEVREQNRWVIYTVKKVEGASAKDLAQVPVAHAGSDDVKTVTATVKGDFFLHGHQVAKDADVEVTFHYPTGQAATAKPTRVDIHTKTPLHVVLADHDVKPRDGFGKLAQGAFNLLGSKVAETADVSLDITASPAATPAAAR